MWVWIYPNTYSASNWTAIPRDIILVPPYNKCAAIDLKNYLQNVRSEFNSGPCNGRYGVPDSIARARDCQRNGP